MQYPTSCQISYAVGRLRQRPVILKLSSTFVIIWSPIVSFSVESNLSVGYFKPFLLGKLNPADWDKPTV